MTALRILGAFCLLFFSVKSGIFWGLYFFCGFSDMADGWLARKLNAVTKSGEWLDSVADICFVVCCGWQLLQTLELPLWLWLWAGVIVVIKFMNQMMALFLYGRCCFPHTTANRTTGLMLFLVLPFTFISIIPLAIVTAFATFAAIHEGYFIKTQQA